MKLEVTNQKFLLFIIAYCLCLTPVYLLTKGVITTLLQLPLLLFFTGYVLLAALFPLRNSFSNITRTVISITISIGAIALIGLITGFTPWGLNGISIYISILVFTLIFALLALLRLHHLPLESRPAYSIDIKFKRGDFYNNSKTDRALIIILIAIVIITAGICTFLITTPSQGEKYTEFYMIPDAKGQYSAEVAANEPVSIALAVVNRENTAETYRIEVKLNNSVILQEIREKLEPSNKWELPVVLQIDKPGLDQRVEFYLYKGEDTKPYTDSPLWLILDVLPES